MKRSTSLAETEQIAADFLRTLVPEKEKATIVALTGDLGSGKTAFAKSIAKIYGVEESVTSPTFVIEKIYRLEGKPFERLVHIDAYRLEGKHEVDVLGWEDIIADPKNLILIEWPENVGSAIPSDAKKIAFTFVDEGVRDIDINNG